MTDADIILLAVPTHRFRELSRDLLNHLGCHELDEPRRSRGATDRIAVAGDDRRAVRAVMRLIDRLGFDPVDAGPLGNGVGLEPDGSPFAAAPTSSRAS